MATEKDGLYISDSSDDPKEDSPVISSHCLELDYEEFPSHDTSTILISSIGISRLVEEEEGEEGELFSDEEGEIKDDTSSVLLSTISNNERSHSCSPVPSASGQQSQLRKSPTPQTSGSICRHFIQGRCSWGEECRFSHTLPPDYSPPPPSPKRSVSPHSPAPANRVYHRPPVRPPPMLNGMPLPMFPLRFPPPIPPSFEGQPYPYPPPPFNIRQMAPPPTISRPAGWGGTMVEKEESDGWLRLRTVTGEDYTPEENTRHKLPMKHQDSEDSDDEAHKKRSHDTPDQWIDPWSRGKRRHAEVDDEVEEEVEKEWKKGKHKDKKKKTKKHKKKKRRSSGSDGDGEMSPIVKTKQRRSSDEVVVEEEEAVWTEDMQYKKLSRKQK